MSKGAVIEGEYRYVLWRTLSPILTEELSGSVLWICLNPSTADGLSDDPTLRKICGFSRRWGFERVRLVNLYALRSTDPKALKTHPDPVGPSNDIYLRTELAAADAVVMAWGAHADPDRAKEVETLIDHVARERPAQLWDLGRTKAGRPKHPLMLGYDTERFQVPMARATRRSGT